ncbi:nitrate ABC transporter permease [Rhizobium sp. AC44/96]|uniref:ABC transporter permease n=1 Tax=unclassified Rhizobium TaxID=2613769 RepID=UPI00080F8C7F|nr:MULTISPECIES: ABC transporter permease subunit [unclassified Rhizobium]MDM9623012.1 ABC transporter permease subunit [Rhizobium sp. S96]OCJ13102.1 nitrate ABC transporter permease [Rhizobium sp. AC44/96]
MTASRNQSPTRFLLGLIGILLFFGLWQLIGTYKLAGMTWPTLTSVLSFIADPARRPLLLRATTASFSSVAIGYSLGVLIGLILAAVSLILASVKPGLDRLVALIHAVPPIALAPVFMTLSSRDATPVALCALGVFYLIYIAATSGFGATSEAHRSLFQTLGAGPFATVLRLYLPSALPSLISGLKLAIPVAFMGEIVGEWFGASRGLGLLMVSGMQNFQIPLLWSAVLITTATSLILFALMGVAERFVEERFR